MLVVSCVIDRVAQQCFFSDFFELGAAFCTTFFFLLKVGVCVLQV